MTIAFELSSTDIKLTNNEQSLSLNAPELQINGSWQPVDGGLNIHNLHLQNPQLSAVVASFSQDMTQLFASPRTTPPPTEQTAQRPLVIDELLLENGTLQLADQHHTMTSPPWTGIHLVVKNFSTAPDPTKNSDTSKNSFILSGGQEATQAALTWQGIVNSRGIPDGELQLKNFQAATLLSFIDPSLKSNASGTATLRGRFIFDPTARNGKMITLMNATTEIHHFSLLDHQQQLWIAAKMVQIKDTQFQEDDRDLGRLSFFDGTLSLHQGQLPLFLKNFDDPKKTIMLQDLNFSGKADLYPEKDKGPSLHLTDLHLQARNLTAKADTRNNVDFTAIINQTGTLQAQGLTTLFPVRSQLALLFADLQAEQIAPWLPDTPLFQQSTAIVAGKGMYHYPEMSYSGNLQLESTLIRNTATEAASKDNNNPDLAIHKAELLDTTIHANPLRIGMKELILDGPQLNWHQENNALLPLVQLGSFFQNLLTASSINHTGPTGTAGTADTADTADTAGSEKNKVSGVAAIQKITIDHGSINHTDLRLTPPWSSTISQLKGSITNLPGTTEQTTGYNVSGLLNESPFTLSGSADLLTHSGDFTTQLDLKGFPLQSLEAQIIPLLDIDPKTGSLDLSLRHQYHKGEEQGEATILCTGLRPHSARADSALPLALLSDTHQQMRLQVPLVASDTRPLFIKALTALQTLLVKATVSPWLLAGDDFSALQEQRFVLFSAGQSELDTISQDSLRSFVELLAVHPQLGLTLTGLADPIQDRAAILQLIEEKEKTRVARINEQQLQQWEARQQEAKQQEARQQKKQLAAAKTPKPVTQPGKIIEQDIFPIEARPVPIPPEPASAPDAVLHDLARERAMQVYDYFTTKMGIDSKRISLEEATQLGTTETPGTQVIIGLDYVACTEPPTP